MLEFSWKPNQLPYPHCDQSKNITVNTVTLGSAITPGTGMLHLFWYIYGALMEIGMAISSLWKLLVEIMLLKEKNLLLKNLVILVLESAESIKFPLLMFIKLFISEEDKSGHSNSKIKHKNSHVFFSSLSRCLQNPYLFAPKRMAVSASLGL